MTSIKINVKNPLEDFKAISKAASEETYKIEVAAGKYIADAKSLVGLFAVDVTEPLEIRAHSSDCETFVAKIQPYVVS